MEQDNNNGTAMPPDPRPDAQPAPAPAMGTQDKPLVGGAAATIPSIEREHAVHDIEPGDLHEAYDALECESLHVSAEVPEAIEASIDFSEVELADEFAEPTLAATPAGMLPMEPMPIEGRLRKAPLRVPDELDECGGFTLFGRRIRSLLYTTDVAVIRNSNAAVWEMQGAAGVVVNSPAPPEMIEQICAIVDIPVIATVVRCDAVAHAKVKAGAKILNVAAGKDTPAVLRELREAYPNLPLIASGGRSSLSVRETVQAGANAVIWTPPSAQQLQADMMRRYREAEVKPEAAVMDPVAAADVNPMESARADVPIPDELIANATTRRRHRGRPGFTPLSIFRNRK